jgi:hypothetical protein
MAMLQTIKYILSIILFVIYIKLFHIIDSEVVHVNTVKLKNQYTVFFYWSVVTLELEYITMLQNIR